MAFLNNHRSKVAYRSGAIFLLLLLSACSSAPSDKTAAGNRTSETDAAVNIQSVALAGAQKTEDTTDYNYATYFIVIADTGLNYDLLHKKMSELHTRFSIPVDTMGRFYNREKDLIALPDDHEDEIYAGDYFPRRFPSDNLSLEYLQFYQKEAGEKTMALVAGIYEAGLSADSVITVLQQTEKNIFKIQANLYIGCMH